MKSGLMCPFTIALAAILPFTSVQARVEPPCKPSAIVKAAEEAKLVAPKHMKVKAVTAIVGTEPYFVVESATGEPPTPEERALQIEQRMLIHGDMVFPVAATLDPAALKHLQLAEKDATVAAGFLIVRCRVDRPTEVETVLWQIDIASQ